MNVTSVTFTYLHNYVQKYGKQYARKDAIPSFYLVGLFITKKKRGFTALYALFSIVRGCFQTTTVW